MIHLCSSKKLLQRPNLASISVEQEQMTIALSDIYRIYSVTKEVDICSCHGGGISCPDQTALDTGPKLRGCLPLIPANITSLV